MLLLAHPAAPTRLTSIPPSSCAAAGPGGEGAAGGNPHLAQNSGKGGGGKGARPSVGGHPKWGVLAAVTPLIPGGSCPSCRAGGTGGCGGRGARSRVGGRSGGRRAGPAGLCWRQRAGRLQRAAGERPGLDAARARGAPRRRNAGWGRGGGCARSGVGVWGAAALPIPQAGGSAASRAQRWRVLFCRGRPGASPAATSPAAPLARPARGAGPS